MCGIAGFYNGEVTTGQVAELLARLKHRGPDQQQFYLHNGVGLLHTRLSIIELSELGAQPYRFENLVVVFNGELYNYKEVRRELSELGYAFISNSDTEVLIKAFHRWGEKCVDKFIGMFAFCVYNEVTNEIFLFRDRVGVKPLYYSFIEGVLFFASELKALLAFGIAKEVNHDAVSLYFRFGFIPGDLSIFRSVSKLEPAHYLRIDGKNISKVKYWNVEPKTENLGEDEWVDKLESILISAFNYRMVADVPVGVFLSGGIDSSLLTAVLQKHYGGIHSFTVGFDEQDFDESGFAFKVASILKTNHVEKNLTLQTAKELFRNFYDMYDEPFADTSGIPTSFVSKLAKQYGMKVVLSADGGDELFGGYAHYVRAFSLYRKFSFLPRLCRDVIPSISRVLISEAFREKMNFLNIEHRAYALEEIVAARSPLRFYEAFIANQSSREIERLMNKKSSVFGLSCNGTDLMQVMMGWDFQYYLPDDLLVKVDRATMFHGIECREPFLDHRLVEFAASVPLDLKIRGGDGKYLLRKLLSRYIPKEYFERKKKGFSIPIFAWFKEDLDKMFARYLSYEELVKIPFLNAAEVEKEYRKYLYNKGRNKQYNVEKMWRLLSFMLWWERYMK